MTDTKLGRALMARYICSSPNTMVNHLHYTHPSSPTTSFRSAVSFQRIFIRGITTAFEVDASTVAAPQDQDRQAGSTDTIEPDGFSRRSRQHSKLERYMHKKTWDRAVKSIDWIEPNESGSLLAYITMCVHCSLPIVLLYRRYLGNHLSERSHQGSRGKGCCPYRAITQEMPVEGYSILRVALQVRFSVLAFGTRYLGYINKSVKADFRWQ